MKTALLASLLAAAFAARAADSAVTFQNNVFRLPDGSQDPSKLVRFGIISTPEIRGTGVRNGVDRGANYVAQLFMVGADGRENAAGPAANFRAATTTQPGTWSGGPRTLTGVAPGTAVNLVVKVWDSNRFSSYEDAVRQSGEEFRDGCGRSPVFSYTQRDPVLQPSDTYMVNFVGFEINTEVVPEPSVVWLTGLGLVGLLLFRRK